ncbi:SGNH/GDSL hydrolase family protein [Accumulibacter sp.]|jgi:hypothetical protein|uniref:SGNH/GDSL hydrolase family protein n=1 Tax=Accumulibacter sp. TaxID=2053492 RepID=UPI00261700D2|nr:SGNH/GDSL hydrolase family protein [Accumulibacter sp.]
MKWRQFIATLFILSAGLANASPNCMVIGDSIAVGVSAMLAKDKDLHCETIAKVGRPTSEVLSKAPIIIEARNVVISTGSNDHRVRPYQFATLRRRIVGNVTWILPAKQHEAREVISRIAVEHGDRVIDLAKIPLGDGIHPTPNGYLTVARTVRDDMKRQVATTNALLLVRYTLSNVGMYR